VLLFALDSSVENSRAGTDGGEGVTQIVPEYGDELFAQTKPVSVDDQARVQAV
jgi:hypothetical protein